MANIKITDLTAATALGGTELFEAVQSGSSVKASATQLQTFVGESLVLSNAVGSFDSITITAGSVPFNTVTNRAYASFYDAGTTDQTGSTTDRTAVKWATAAVAGAGITVASDSRITLAAAGTYRVNASLQFSNSQNTTYTVFLWFAKNGTNIADTGVKITVPAANAGGTYLLAYEIFETVAANDYLEMYWYPSNVAATLHYIAPVAANPGVTPAIPATPPAIVVVERVA
jgi:hypothetical protein